eukprot:351171-Chlamydomonas_euryale.AAC.2
MPTGSADAFKCARKARVTGSRKGIGVNLSSVGLTTFVPLSKWSRMAERGRGEGKAREDTSACNCAGRCRLSHSRPNQQRDACVRGWYHTQRHLLCEKMTLKNSQRQPPPLPSRTRNVLEYASKQEEAEGKGCSRPPPP